MPVPFYLPKSKNYLKKTKANQDGKSGEFLALFFLRLKGYRCLAQNYKTPVGEIDLVMRKGKTLIFVEVKTRPSLNEALEALRQAQQKRILKTALWFMKEFKAYTNYDMRFDFIGIAPSSWPKHIQNAWGAD